ncbi:MAG: hypothetical protein ABF461_05085 [Zymomonas mobilis subsp. pomaceae]|uniref:Uncharacterized protein n=1 Tax=Zymomonas mobilis subsp. pomaceae (strain ATCC 29192 / DSM 22645 / JCM 10191 / CCUG 17912 / NBRC 13757 / NCIMB 11200 / NRRL B-4491 / Barker I) TaxID=579138 RepID=F8EVJ8_ZYMMT|nr:hypothetical protein [Zymomonas mobilis]AEI38335.1 hypothetical protein Zymop_1445 [Zymomonas mobilis subsp. pomaceae ATCC 29192]MDX5948024.1 hypothetical protein [Zymomonas mobilis subsp. pomaceae]GEB89354.1 hypothetical protein ZMO02_09910 [Zymomonas mobilis subsp. pomaceae]
MRISVRISLFCAAAFSLTGLAFLAPSTARPPTMTVYGNESCPAGYICVTKPAGDKYRVPEELRDEERDKPDQQSWAARQQIFQGAGAQGAGSCTTSGSGSEMGCGRVAAHNDVAERRAAKERLKNSAMPQ